MDLIIGKGGKEAILTLVDRLTGYLIIERLPQRKNAKSLATHKKKNMKNSLILQYDKVLLRKRVLIESVNDELKNICQIEHTKHRSIHNFAAILVAGLIAYQTLDKKPSLNLEQFTKQNLVA